MTSPKNLALAFLAAAVAGTAVLAWRQYAELVELRALAMNRDERADLQKRIWDLEKANRELNDRLAAGSPAATDEEADELEAMLAESGGPAGNEARDRRRTDPRRSGMQQFAALRELMSKPEVQALLNVQRKAAIEAQYAALFRNLNLSPEQAEKLKTLLADRSSARQDVFEAARSQGIDPRENPEAYRKLLADTRAEIDRSIKSVVGDAGFAQLQNYEQTLPQRGVVNELQQRLSFSQNPLTPAQADQLVQVLASNSPQRTDAGAGVPDPANGGRAGMGGRGPDMGMLFGPGAPGGVVGAMMGARSGAPITDNAIAQAQGVLSQPQVATLQQMQKQQQSQQQLSRMFRETMSANQPANTRRATRPDAAGGKKSGGG